jgi:hypothetical protein
MPTNDDMTTPITRRDLDEVLDQRLSQLRTELRTELAADRAALRAEIFADRRATDEVLLENVRATNAVLLEDAFKRFRVIDDQYKDLPTRVAKLERKVFPPPRRKRAG